MATVLQASLRWLLCGLLWVLPAAWAASPAVDVAADMTALAPFVELCEDGSNQLTLDAVLRGSCTFQAANGATMSKGFSASDWWLRVRLANTRAQAVTRWISVGHPKISLVHLYYRAEGGNWNEQVSGLLIPAAQRPVIASTPVLPVRLEAGQEVEMLVRVSSKGALDLSMHAWEPSRYLSTYQQMQLAHAVALGGLLLAGLFSIAIFFQLRDRSFLYYGLAMWCEIGVELVNSGVWPQYLWPTQRAFPIEILPMCVAGAVIGFTLFLHSFLGKLKRFALTAHLFHGSVAVLLGGLFWAVAVQYRQGGLVWSLAVVAMLVFSVALIAQAAWQGSRQAKLLMVTTSAICVLELLRLGVTLGLNSISITMIASAPWAFVLTAPVVLAGIASHASEMREKYLLEKHASDIRSQFLARVGHDLRAPLSTILGFSRMLETGSERATPREAGSAIGRSGKVLLRQIDDLLDLAMLDVERLRIRAKAFALPEWLEGIRISAEMMCLDAGNRLVLEATKLPAVVIADADRLNQVLTNLLNNANQASTHGTITLRCRCEETTLDSALLCFSVSDTGVGIPDADQTKIFEAFEQGSSAHRHPSVGIGLGLAIASNLVEAMGSKIALQSKVGAGSTFEFTIQCALATQLDEPDQGKESAVRVPVDSQGRAVLPNGKRILVVEDEASERVHLSEMLVQEGYQVMGAQSLAQAVADPLQELDAVITDQYLTDGTGWQVLEFFSNMFPGLPVILISNAWPQTPQGWNAQLKFHAIFRKPVEFELLLKQLHAAVGMAVLVLPSESDLLALRGLIQGGEVTLIEQWAQSLKLSNPKCIPYCDQVLGALLLLDFDRLQQLSVAKA
jgi:signal transduction histidine kinase/CheY-like chemotaxis protein